MKKILTAAAILVCATSLAQNLNPTVEVTNIYQGNPSEVHKPQAKMAIPDSLMRFDMDFGYEVFEKPYQGAYNFKPPCRQCRQSLRGISPCPGSR